MPLPVPFDGFVEVSKRVSPTCLISFERNRYSVPASCANRPVSLPVYPDRLVVAAEGQILCEHTRIIHRSHNLPMKTVYDWRHCLAVVQRKPGALWNGAPFLELPSAFRQLQEHMLRKPGGDGEMVDILALVLQHDEQAVLTAVELALAESVPTRTHVLNLLHRLVDGKVISGPPLDTPQALALQREPKANVERYDALRSQIAGAAMRHDPAAAAIVIMLRSLKMYGMAQAAEDLIEQGAPAFEAAISILSQLPKAELAEREVRSIAYHMKSARFPASNCYDNSAVESFFKSLKAELIWRRNWQTRREVEVALFE
jgi:hypothetical protein